MILGVVEENDKRSNLSRTGKEQLGKRLLKIRKRRKTTIFFEKERKKSNLLTLICSDKNSATVPPLPPSSIPKHIKHLCYIRFFPNVLILVSDILPLDQFWCQCISFLNVSHFFTRNLNENLLDGNEISFSCLETRNKKWFLKREKNEKRIPVTLWTVNGLTCYRGCSGFYALRPPLGNVSWLKVQLKS